jgi:hypothetical protein
MTKSAADEHAERQKEPSEHGIAEQNVCARWVGLIGLALFGTTWRLWIPQDLYPQIPLISFGRHLPEFVEWAALALVVCGLPGLLIRGASSTQRGATQTRVFATLYLAGYLLLVTIDQHRLQPWAYHLALIVVLLAWHARPLLGLRWLLMSIYFFSAAGKLDHTFLHTVGAEFVQVPFDWLGVQPPPVTLQRLAVLLPLGELLIVVVLLRRRTVKVGRFMAIAAHVSLLVILGPLGLGHRPGVLLWNVFFIGLWGLLPSLTRWDIRERTRPAAQSSTGNRFATVILAAAICLPMLEPMGLWDHWISWGLYSPRNSRTTLSIHQTALDRLVEEKLEASCLKFLGAPDNMGWRPVQIDQWSLEELGVPIYPQDRFQFGVTRDVVSELKLKRGFRIDVYGMANRWTGKRKVRSATSQPELTADRWQWRLNNTSTKRQRVDPVER